MTRTNGQSSRATIELISSTTFSVQITCDRSPLRGNSEGVSSKKGYSPATASITTIRPVFEDKRPP
eukprot:2284480-Pyramimonas_sp.AAC.1